MNLLTLNRLAYKCQAFKKEGLAQASEDLKTLMPDIDFERNIDLFGVVYEGAVVGRFNKNDDGIDAEEALRVYKDFLHKPVNVRHSMLDVIGVIVGAGLSEYGSEGKRILSEEEASKMNEFCLSFASVIFQRVPTYDCYQIIESTNPNSSFYHGMSASWEIMFSDYDIGICDNDETSIAECERVNRDDPRFKGMVYNLRAYGGSGVLKNGKLVKRILKNTLPGGIGFTETPAASVKGIDSIEEPENYEWFDGTYGKYFENDEASASILFNKDKKNVNKVENTDKTVIIKDTPQNMDKEDIKKAVTEAIAEGGVATASAIDALVGKLHEGAQSMANKLTEKETALSEATSKIQEQEAAIAAQTEKLAVMEAEVAKLQEAQAQAKAQADFQGRFAQVDEKYTITEAQRIFVTEDVKGCKDDEAFASLLKRYDVMFPAKAETQKPEGKTEKEKLEESKASVVVDIPNGSETESKDLLSMLQKSDASTIITK